MNWHGTCIGTPASTLFGGGPAFVASTTPKPACISNTGGAWQNGWIYTMFPLDEFNGDTISKLEMVFEFASSFNNGTIKRKRMRLLILKMK